MQKDVFPDGAFVELTPVYHYWETEGVRRLGTSTCRL